MGVGEQWGRGKGRGGRGEGGNTATLKTFFSAMTRKRYYRIHTSVPPSPLGALSIHGRSRQVERGRNAHGHVAADWGERFTAAWLVYLSDSGMPPMFVISEADYEARKKRITDRPKNTDDAKTRKQSLVTAGEMGRAMELDDQVDKVISSLKRKQDLKDDGASSTTGVVVVQEP